MPVSPGNTLEKGVLSDMPNPNSSGMDDITATNLLGHKGTIPPEPKVMPTPSFLSRHPYRETRFMHTELGMEVDAAPVGVQCPAQEPKTAGQVFKAYIGTPRPFGQQGMPPTIPPVKPIDTPQNREAKRHECCGWWGV